MIKEDFLKTFGEGGADLDCSCWYHNNFVYEFTFHLKGIEQIDFKSFTIIGDIVDIDGYGMPPTLRQRIVPKKVKDIVLVYYMDKRSLSFRPSKSGLTIYPYDNGKDSWRKLLGLVGEHLAKLMVEGFTSKNNQ